MANDQPRVSIQGTVKHARNAVDMSDYPLLVYGPRDAPQVKVASNGTPVADIFKFRDSTSGLPEGGLARLFGISPEEMAEVERWEADENAPGK